MTSIKDSAFYYVYKCYFCGWSVKIANNCVFVFRGECYYDPCSVEYIAFMFKFLL